MPTRRVALEVRELEAASNLDLLVDFDLVARLNVVVALHADTAFHAGTYFGSVILEAAQGFQLAFEDNDVFTQYTDWTLRCTNLETMQPAIAPNFGERNSHALGNPDVLATHAKHA